MGTSSEVLVGATGVVYGGPSGTTAPTDAVVALNAAFVDLGFVDENGVTESITQGTQEIKAWGGSTIRKIQTDHTVEFKLGLLETNPHSVAAYYGSDNVVTTGADKIEVTSDMNTRQSWVIDVVDGTNTIRVYIPDGEVTGHEDVVYKTDSAIVYGITITAYEDSAGVKAYKFLHTAVLS